MERDVELRELNIEIERLKHELRLEEERLRHEAEMELERERRETALMVEEQRRITATQTENRKGLWALGAGIAGVAAGVLITVIANRRDISQRDISQNVNNKRLFR